MSDSEKRRRWLSTANTWVGNAASILHEHAEQATDEQAHWIRHEAKRFVNALFIEIETLYPLLTMDDGVEFDDYDFDDVEENARNLVEALRLQRQIFKLGNVEGCPPDEAKSRLEKREEYRRRLGA
jgi:hypothetical protein